MNKDFNQNIDDFYNEEASSYVEFQKDDVYINSLESMKKYMDSIEDINHLNFSLESIINQAIEKKEGKITKEESIYFLILSTVIMTILAIITMNVNINFIIYLQMFMILIPPFIIIPIALTRARRNNL
ncbi:hypothetical protein JOC70_000637 [Clostridium pascui]|uniref:hypothetical protein n=1 Tax=Clostridium pascui TaxID=46609 RepID=UPI00195C8A01|nr:hypothetical protein [Clostridium pascui]MBM7869168.1 hypothetical protein [Clostridium pascui]